MTAGVRCFPPDPEFPDERSAEQRVWEALRDQLPDEAALFHSVQLIERNQHYEADIVVAWPGVGLAVIEVKGGHVTREAGEWHQESHSKSRRIGDPVVQAQDCLHVLNRYLSLRRLPVATARAAHLVAFPFTGVDEDWEIPGCARDMVIARQDIRRAADVVRSCIERHGIGARALDNDDVEELIGVLERQLGGQTSLLSMAEEHEHRVDQLTREQGRILNALRYQRRMKVIGGAGTGKTWLALAQAHRLARDGERVALVCYSRGLARFFERMTATWPARERPAYVGLFHALPLQWGADEPPSDEDRDAQSDYYERRLPEQMATIVERLPDSEKFDSVVVDEAQDFGELWWPPTVAMLKDRDNGGLFAFLDEAQRVFNRYGEVPIPLPPISLDENVRNTKRIAQVFGSLTSQQTRYRGIEGPPVRFHQCAGEDVIPTADDAVDALLAEGWADGEIALLTTGRRHPQQVSEIEYDGWAGYWDAFFAEESVFYGHVLGFKGLERPAVVLAVNGIRDEARAKEYLYVGLSRARTQLVVCGDLDEIARIGGEGVRRRLAAAAV